MANATPSAHNPEAHYSRRLEQLRAQRVAYERRHRSLGAMNLALLGLSWFSLKWRVAVFGKLEFRRFAAGVFKA
jgi:hypothetical protein